MKVMEVILVRQVILEMQETQIMQIMQENLHICESTSEFIFVWTKYAWQKFWKTLSVRLKPKFDSLPSFYQVHILHTAASSLHSLSKSL